MSTTTATKKINISGVQGGRGPNNQTPARLELSTHLQDPDRKNLLLLGLERMQARPQNDPKSWYQVAGIHGEPYKPWDGEADARGRKPGGYCTHSSVLFLTWHRPYLALYEQVLYDDVQAVAQSFPAGAKRDQLLKIASTFRIPYWDWASQPNPDPVLLERNIAVDKPNGRVTIPNPLYSYRFQNTSDFQESNYRNWKQTLRYPASDNATESQDIYLKNIGQTLQARSMEDRFGGRRGTMINIRERIYHLLNAEQNRYPTYPAFSNDRWVKNGRSSDYDSIESVHNSLHSWIGGNGHMGDPSVAGFDPIFWLHHCNIDRMYALWQALHPDADLKWEFGDDAETNNPIHWWVPRTGQNQREEENTPLVPFHKTDSQYWDSNAVRDLKAFGYTYPELAEWNIPGVTREQLKTKVAATVKKLYANTTTSGSLFGVSLDSSASPFMSLASTPPSSLPPVEKKPAAAPAAQKVLAQNPLQAAATAATSHPPLKPTDHILTVPVSKIVKDRTHREYFANVRAPKYRFNGPFVVHVFIGDFTDDYTQRPYDKNLVGSTHVFANDVSRTGCENCKKNAENNLMVTGSVPLTSALLERINELGSLEIDAVEPYLKKNLHWRIHRMNVVHDNIDRTTAEGVEFTVTSAIVEHPTTPQGLPVYRDWNPIPGITAGKPTGADYDSAEGYEG
ncbi:Di-copper centre-containing protein [Wilcoxina mikolae CBS 423.85]|nr:Di-copper centre-containing protein [Wilcoxina mikolae CBS 423.85]